MIFKVKFVKAGEYAIARAAEEKGFPIALVTENLGADIAIAICNLKTQTVALARQINLSLIKEITNELLADSPEEEPSALVVTLVGGEGVEKESTKQKTNLKESPGYIYFMEILRSLPECAGPTSKYDVSQFEHPTSLSFKIIGERCIFHIIGSDILDKPHPNSVYFSPRFLSPRHYTKRIESLLTGTVRNVIPSIITDHSKEAKKREREPEIILTRKKDKSSPIEADKSSPILTPSPRIR